MGERGKQSPAVVPAFGTASQWPQRGPGRVSPARGGRVSPVRDMTIVGSVLRWHRWVCIGGKTCIGGSSLRRGVYHLCKLEDLYHLCELYHLCKTYHLCELCETYHLCEGNRA